MVKITPGPLSTQGNCPEGEKACGRGPRHVSAQSMGGGLLFLTPSSPLCRPSRLQLYPLNACSRLYTSVELHYCSAFAYQTSRVGRIHIAPMTPIMVGSRTITLTSPTTPLPLLPLLYHSYRSSITPTAPRSLYHSANTPTTPLSLLPLLYHSYYLYHSYHSSITPGTPL